MRHRPDMKRCCTIAFWEMPPYFRGRTRLKSDGVRSNRSWTYGRRCRRMDSQSIPPDLGALLKRMSSSNAMGTNGETVASRVADQASSHLPDRSMKLLYSFPWFHFRSL